MELLRTYARYVQHQLERERKHAVSFMWCYAMVCHFWPEVKHQDVAESARDRLVEMIRPHAR